MKYWQKNLQINSQKHTSNKIKKTKNFFLFFILTLLSSSLYMHQDLFCAGSQLGSTCTTCQTDFCSCGSCPTCSYDCNECCLRICDGYPYFQIRSQGRDMARELIAWQPFINRYDIDYETYGAFSFTVEYTRAFRRERLMHYLLGDDLINCCELYIQGSDIENRHAKAWLADYFGLPTDFNSRINFYPNIQNIILDFNFYIGLDELAKGLFLKIHAPFVWSKWTLNACEKIISKGVSGFESGYMSEDKIDRSSLSNSFLKVMTGGYIFGDMKIPLRFGKILSCDTKSTKIAQIDLTFGYNFSLKENHHFGLLIYGSVPTGSRPQATTLFEPIIGNGKHWEVGLGLSGSWIFWRSEKHSERYLGVWFEGIMGHLFKTGQCRSFDLCGNPNSRYMLLEEMGDNNDDIQALVDGEIINATYQYAKNLIPAINWSTFNVQTKINLQGDIAIKIGGALDNWHVDVGYNLWARTGEKFSCGVCNCNTNKTYAIKGDSTVYGQYIVTTTTTKVPLSATQSLASVHSGKNFISEGTLPETNPEIDNPYLALTNGIELFSPAVTIAKIDTSIQPILVTRKNLYLCKSPSSITHKIFGYFGYAWKDRNLENIPFIGIGGNVEFAQDNYEECCNLYNNCNACGCGCGYGLCDSCCDTYIDGCSINSSCGSCGSDCTGCGYGYKKKTPRVGLSQWGVWVKGGVSFD